MLHTITLNLIFILKKGYARAFFLILTRALEHVFCLGESRLSQVNNSPRPNVFPAGVANFGKAMYQFCVSVPRKVNPGHPGWIFSEFEQITANCHETSLEQ